MCGRYSNRLSWREIHDLYELTNLPINLEPRSNIAPTQSALVIRRGDDGQRHAAMLRWGLIPSWVKNPKKVPILWNARVETIATHPSYREPVRWRRALAIADGYYEWTGRKGTKQPWRFVRPDASLIAFAAIWETWRVKEGRAESEGAEPIESFIIVTAQPSPDIAHIHDCMPVILNHADIGLWLDPDPVLFDQQMALLKPAPIGTLRYFLVSTRVNSSRNEGPKLIEPVARLADGGGRSPPGYEDTTG